MAEPQTAPAKYRTRKKPRWGLLVLVVLGHVLALIGLVHVFAPRFAAATREEILVVFDRVVAITVPEDPPAPSPDEGAAAEEGREASAREVSAPIVPVPARPVVAPPVSSTGTEANSGAADAGAGTGAGGDGTGTGSGNAGTGPGAGCGISSRPVKIAGDIRSASDFPIPPGGRQARFGTSVTIALTVARDGRPTSCRIHTPSPFPETDQRTCELAMQRFRFCPATDAQGNAVVGTYGWRQEFREAQ
ncbi:MAG TPA: energy transducer TonB [Sphingomonadaceae bacterium]|nr:energy transducer TonB [Sphingomonadaceae bacterium]